MCSSDLNAAGQMRFNARPSPGFFRVVISIVKAGTFGLIAGLVGCYRGLTVAGGAKGVGTAVNETLVLCVIALFAVNVVLTTIGVRFGTGR